MVDSYIMRVIAMKLPRLSFDKQIGIFLREYADDNSPVLIEGLFLSKLL